MQLIPEVVTVSDARAGLSRILADLEHGGATAEPVLIGAHRKPQGVLLSVEVYEALQGRTARRAVVESATASLALEGLRASAESDRDAEAYVNGELNAEEAVALAVARHSSAAVRRAK
ncbi:type II toxin-antitoxin system Phd/YefM family antitoxin [Streptomyces sp. ISL-96]|uniref:antitoxin VbhA family protein n=1 Tax=Streptomyces sp. ISL-96 TaxID=2819191 RepID=UPI001BE7A4DF|nr:type II toxin-antitoxin system Phd/YefM family antitoxin [Streptomyces sp. ISL-96]MBT2488212.1 type II toxin-antitoxin system Phd/YefM family antitoxin [Streptomyces sp. ISL-96]